MRVRPISNTSPERVMRKTAPRIFILSCDPSGARGLLYSMLDRAFGLARSLAIYHAIPFRQRRLRRLYRGVVRRGDLVIDVAAHAGNHVRALAALGCRVIAIEPQPDFARMLRLLFGRSRHVTILERGVGDRPGRAQLSVSERTP